MNQNSEDLGGNAEIRARSWAEIDRLREQFEALSPWRDTLKTPFLKLEKKNFGEDGKRRQLYAYCVSAKLYCLFNLAGGRLVIRKPSGHSLGFLQAPYRIAAWHRRTGRKWNEDLPPWIFEAWHFIFSRELGLPHTPPRWLNQPGHGGTNYHPSTPRTPWLFHPNYAYRLKTITFWRYAKPEPSRIRQKYQPSNLEPGTVTPS